MTLFDVQRLSNHWRRNPPLRTLVAGCAAALGVNFSPTEPEKKKYLNEKEAHQALLAFNAMSRG